jgi:hypothetical protein
MEDTLFSVKDMGSEMIPASHYLVFHVAEGEKRHQRRKRWKQRKRRRSTVLPSKLECHRCQLSQPALMSNNIDTSSVITEDNGSNDHNMRHRSSLKTTAATTTTCVSLINHCSESVKLTVKCYNSYHSHFDEL